MKVAITGTGFMGTVHAEALKRLRGVEVVGIQGSSPEKSRRAAEQLELPKAYHNWQELVADPEVEAVHITTPNRLHYPQTVDALKAGKHVLCEKPLAMTTGESAELVRLAKASGLVTGVNYNIRFYPLNLEAKQRVADGELGDIHSIFGSYQQDWLLKDTDYNWRVLAEEQGVLRAVADIGTHWIDLIQNITGKNVTEVFADLRTVHPVRKRPLGEVQTFSGSDESQATEPVNITTDDIGCLLLRFEGGARGSLFVSQVTAGLKNSLRYEIAGSQSAVQWNSEAPNQIWRGHRDKANELLHKDPSLNTGLARAYTDYPGGHAEGFQDTFKMCFRAFYNFIAAGGIGSPDFATFEEGHQEIQLCEAVQKSAQEQRWITI
jgi:predicted dehydrogenase